MSDFTTAPLYQPSVDALAERGLRMELVDTSEVSRFAPWHDALGRGFHGSRLEGEVRDGLREALAFRRTTGVYDDASPEPLVPVGTANSWPAALTAPGERTLDGWAISCVTVASTHRRRGIARGMLEAELGTAAALGLPLAMLTVSESSIYGRFGFAPAAMAADWKIDTRKAGWTGPVPEGRVDFVPVERWRALVPGLHDTARLLSPGEVEMWPGRWDQAAGILSEDTGFTKALRAVQYTDATGALAGLALFRVRGSDDFDAHRVVVDSLISTLADAYAALWRFLLEIDLVSSVEAELRSVDEPVRWMISDWRAAEVTTWEHQYLRILDVAASFEARSYASVGSVVFEVSDPLGYASGTWLLTVPGSEAGTSSAADAGTSSRPGTSSHAVVEPVETPPPGIPALALGVNELSALYLGGVAVPTLVGAGR
ncbi:MAG TPA: GNAT family N-acetyltransferase, partial [Pseudolysinimonas sp.]|nr:GNAT family N-acetyltransferase [Pseudolysinimonas sp.]